MSRTKALIEPNNAAKENRCHSKFENEREHFQRLGEPAEMWRLVASLLLVLTRLNQCNATQL